VIGSHQFDHLWQAADEHVDMSADEIVHGGIAGSVRQVLDVEMAEALEKLDRDMVEAADAG
jgi:enoyl reductase-like protein